MAVIIVQEHEKGENIDRAIKRFSRMVGKEGILREYKKHTFFTGLSQAKRIKRREAQKRRRKTEIRTRRFRPNPDAKVIPFYPDTEWPVDMKNKPRRRIFDTPRPFFKRPQNDFGGVFDHVSHEAATDTGVFVGPAEAAGFGEDQRRRHEEQLKEGEGTLEIPEKTVHAGGIMEYYLPGFGKGLVIVRNYDDNGNPEIPFGFPGGAVKLEEGETPEEGAVREAEEETGLKSKEDGLVFSMEDGPFHEKKFFRLVCLGGIPKAGEEIVELKLASPEGIENLIKIHGFKRDHIIAFYEYRKRYLNIELPESDAQKSQEEVKNV